MLSARVALMLALRQGPCYGSQLVGRIQHASHGAARFALGSLYPALRSLEQGHLVRSWTVVPGRRRGGRARLYYELTARGARSTELARNAIAGLLDLDPPGRADSSEEIERRMRRLRLAEELSEAMFGLRRRVSARRRRGAA